MLVKIPTSRKGREKWGTGYSGAARQIPQATGENAAFRDDLAFFLWICGECGDSRQRCLEIDLLSGDRVVEI